MENKKNPVSPSRPTAESPVGQVVPENGRPMNGSPMGQVVPGNSMPTDEMVPENGRPTDNMTPENGRPMGEMMPENGRQNDQIKTPNLNPPGCNMTHDCMSKVGYSYVPVQAFNDIYPPAEGLARGTIFPELDKPFGMYGAEVG